jgi:plasmid stability protein
MTMPNLTLKNIPAALHLRLKARAEANRRSLNREILALLEAQLEAPAVDLAAEQKALEDLVTAMPPVDHARVRRYRDAGRA